jgi:hypothetical protein
MKAVCVVGSICHAGLYEKGLHDDLEFGFTMGLLPDPAGPNTLGRCIAIRGIPGKNKKCVSIFWGTIQKPDLRE